NKVLEQNAQIGLLELIIWTRTIIYPSPGVSSERSCMSSNRWCGSTPLGLSTQ
ncbi:hypothetical protein AMECASPLE_009789, partial [Ameca splendens]